MGMTQLLLLWGLAQNIEYNCPAKPGTEQSIACDAVVEAQKKAEQAQERERK